ncbi:hypothetical protein OQZ55_00125 [Bacillus subtilis]|uniref:hypothetical protein n=1 Tax=Bacillus subtilis TaxID=1423 RepID=UPI00225A613F|nr:hypothetical protein [Bacillus subtilis]MCX4074721.1 hypothetical protein [Bacillus subtilis]MEC0396302.1 hypothetical protein [Bacillus subtilis]WBC28231.1 hypothetical protein O6U12_22425 [Bacillus subtilis]
MFAKKELSVRQKKLVQYPYPAGAVLNLQELIILKKIAKNLIDSFKKNKETIKACLDWAVKIGQALWLLMKFFKE